MNFTSTTSPSGSPDASATATILRPVTILDLTDPVNGTTADATVIQANNGLVEAAVNGGLSDENVQVGAALAPAKIAPGTNGQYLVTAAGVATWQTMATGADVGRTATQTIPDATDTAVAFTFETYDVGGFHDTGANTSRLTIPAGGDGLYLITAHIEWEANVTGNRQLWIRDDLSNEVSRATTVQSGLTGVVQMETFTVLQLAAAQYVELMVRQTSGGGLKVNLVGGRSPRFKINRLS